MLIDWITARIPLEQLSPEARQIALTIGDRIQRFCPKSGDIRFTSPAWDSIRSDSHQIAIKAGTDLWIQGSPARLTGEGCTVFGSGPSSELDLISCLKRMIFFVSSHYHIELPNPEQWTVSRIDVTENLFLQSLPAVRVALSELKNCEGGRYRVSAQAGDTVYWSKNSRMRKGKAYAKGPHLRHLMKQKTYTGKRYTETEILQAESLLRLELTLGREFLSRHDWKTLTPDLLAREWHDYFLRMIGDADMSNDPLTIQEKISKVAPTEGQAKAAYVTWKLIQNQGWQSTKDLQTKSTWYRNIKILKEAGFGDLDLSSGTVVTLRRKVLDAQPVTNWPELERLSA